MLSKGQIIISVGIFFFSLFLISRVHAQGISGAIPFIPTPTATPTVTPLPTLTPTPTLIPTYTPTPTVTPTPTPTNTPTPIPATDYESYFDQYSSHYGVNKELLKKIAMCESGINPGAANGPYGGMYQFHEDSWKATRAEMGLDTNPNLRFGAKESIETAAFKISRGGEKAWSNCL